MLMVINSTVSSPCLCTLGKSNDTIPKLTSGNKLTSIGALYGVAWRCMAIITI